MKQMSKFFLIISGIMIAVGAVTCIIGAILAKSQGVLLFSEKKDEGYVYTVNLENTDISRISIDATDADITVYTGQEKEYIEFINFNEKYISVSSTNTVVSFDEYVNLNSLVSFWERGYTFKGMRSLLSLRKAPKGAKKVNIYISDDREINVFSFTLEKGAVVFDNINSDTDYKISLDSGSVKMKNISTSSKFYLTAAECTVQLDNCSFESLIGDVGNIRMNGSFEIQNEFTVNSKDGTIEADVDMPLEDAKISIQTSGAILYNGETYSGTYRNTDASDKSNSTTEKMNISVTGDTLNVSLNNINSAQQKNETEEK